MRLFVAVEIEAAVAERVAALSTTLRRVAHQAAPGARVTWVTPERLHLTVRFIGEVDESRADTILRALQPRIDVAPFELTIGGAGAFPPRGAPRALWLGVDGDVGLLRQVQEQVSARLAACGVPAEGRAYRPHLTLARVREAAGLRAGALLEGVSAEPIGRTRVDAITLFESRLSPKGPTYVALQRTPLRRI